MWPDCRCRMPGSRCSGACADRKRSAADRPRPAPARRDRNVPRSTPSSVKRWIMPVSRSATKSWRDARSNARPPSAGPEFGTPSSSDIGEQRHGAGAAIDFPDRSRPAVGSDRTEQAGHESGVRRAAARAIRHVHRHRRRAPRSAVRRRRWRRRRCSAGPRRRARAKRPARSGARSTVNGLWRGDELGLRRPAHAGKTDHPQRGTIEVDVGLVDASGLGWGGEPMTVVPENPTTAASPTARIGGALCAKAAADRHKRHTARAICARTCT